MLLLYKHVLQYIKQKCALYAYTTEQIKIDIVWFIETFKIFWSHIHFSTIYWIIYLLVWINFCLQGTVFNSDSKFFFQFKYFSVMPTDHQIESFSGHYRLIQGGFSFDNHWIRLRRYCMFNTNQLLITINLVEGNLSGITCALSFRDHHQCLLIACWPLVLISC